MFCCKLCIDYEIVFFFFQAEDGIRDLVRSRGLGDVYKRQTMSSVRLIMSSSVIIIGILALWQFVNQSSVGGLLSLIHI